MDKRELRKIIKERKSAYTITQLLEKSEMLFFQIEHEPAFLEAKTVMIYWAMSDEVQTQAFIQKWQDEKQFILPSVNDDILELKKYCGIKSLIPGEQFGILEPIGDLFTDYEEISLIIVPGVAFDKNNNRMGRGRGYYDKFLNEVNATKFGVCFDFQMLDFIPTEEHDIKMDKVFSA